MDKDKAIRSAKLTAAGILDKARARTAVTRAGGQIAPSKYLPNIPRQVHAGGGKVDFVKDNPGGDWLAKKQGYAFEYPRMKGIDGAITGWMGGKSDLFLPTHVLKSIEPLNNEKRVAGEPRFDDLMSSVSKEGFDPHQKGNKVVVAVNHQGKPFILEGNTRVAVAHAMGVPSVKAEVRYWNGAEEADGPMHPDQVFGMASDSPDITKAGGGNVEGEEDGITAYHGSPHDFDQFDIAHLGTGEGVQAYGHGLYFAGNEKIAKHYRDTLTGYRKYITTKTGLKTHIPEEATNFISDGSSDPQISYPIQLAVSEMQRGSSFPDAIENMKYNYSHFDQNKLAQAIGFMNQHKPSVNTIGNMYKVKLNVKPEELLDWDKPLSEQHQKVQRAIKEWNNWRPAAEKLPKEIIQGSGIEPNGSHIYHHIANIAQPNNGDLYGNNAKGQEFASGELQDMGLKGIRYLDAGSRNDPDGNPTHNYVMFHHDPVQVVNKYEYGGTVGKEEGGRVGKFYGGAMGYIPTNWVQAQELAVAKAPRQPQQQQTSTLDTIFQLNELSKMGGTKPTAIAPSPSAASEGHPPTAGVSDAARAAFDALNKGWTGAPISVESAYRDPALNEAVGGAKGSQHLHGNAYDIDTSGWTPEAKLALATQAYNSGFRGFGFYDNNLHFDVGGQRAWGPSYHQDSIPDWAQDWTQQYVYANGGRVGKDVGGAMDFAVPPPADDPTAPGYRRAGSMPKAPDTMLNKAGDFFFPDVFRPMPSKNGYKFGDAAIGMATPYLKNAYDLASTATTMTPDPNSYAPEAIQRINHYLGNMGLAGLSAALAPVYGGAGLVGDVANSFGVPNVDALVRDLGAGIDVAGINPESRILSGMTANGVGSKGTQSLAAAAESAPPAPAFQNKWQQVLSGQKVDLPPYLPPPPSVISVQGPSSRPLVPDVYNPIGPRAGSGPARPSDPKAAALGFNDTVYHATASTDPFTQFDLDRSSSGFETRQFQDYLGAHVGTAKAARERHQAVSESLAGYDANTAPANRVNVPLQGMTMELRARTDSPVTKEELAKVLGVDAKKTFSSGTAPLTEADLNAVFKNYGDQLLLRDPSLATYYGTIPPQTVAQYLRRDLADKGFTHIPYINSVEDRGNISYIMLTDRPQGSPAVLRDVRAGFDPSKINDPDLRFDNGGTVGRVGKEGGGATGSLREKALWPSAQAIKAGTGSREAHAEMVNKIKPVSPYDAPVAPASDEQVHDALTKDKQPKAFVPRGLKEGTPVAVRLDIPAYEKKNTWVVSVHHPKTDFTAGEVIGYDSVAHIGNPRFGVHPTGALNIASGKPKATIATVHGNWKKTTPEDAFRLSQTIHNDPQWRQVGMDPERHSYFYDRETQEPVMAADEALHIGPLVYAKNPVYGKKTDFAFSKGGEVEQIEQPANGMHMLRMRRAGINTKEDFWNRWRDHMRAKAMPNLNLSAIGSEDSHFQQIDNLLNFHRQSADANGIRGVLQRYGQNGQNKDGSMAASMPKAILQGAGIEPTIDNASQIYHSLPDNESGRVGKAGGGEMDGVESNNQNGVSNVGTQNETGIAPFNPAPRAQAGELRDAGRVRGGSGVLQTPLEGLLTPVTIPMTGQVIHAGPDPRVRQVARDYMASTGLPYNPPKKYAKADPTRALRISDAYEAMEDNSSDPLTKASYAAMIKETMAQYHAAKAAGFKAEFWDPQTQEDPYHASPRLATEDIKNNNHMFVFPTDSGYGSDGPITAEQIKTNPLLQPSGETWNGIPVTVNDIFRAVHDYFGHAKEGVGFRADGEENAWRSHAAMYSPLARMAMTSETRGQNSWLNFNPVSGERNRKARTENSTFADQKVGILPHWVHHEGAEDFMGPEEVNAMAAIRKVHGRASGGAVDDALALTRRFTKDGTGATLALKSKGK